MSRFWSRHKSGDYQVQQGLVEFAKTKLAPDVIGTRATDSQLAALDVRLLLDFERSEIALNKEADLVESRMRIVYSIPKHRRITYSGYPSEPILAEAAAKCWAELLRAIISIPGLLLKFMDNGYIGKGERGELVARLLLTLAFDAAVKQHTSADTRRSQSQQYTHSVPLNTFLEELFGVEHARTILKSYPTLACSDLGRLFRMHMFNSLTSFARAIPALCPPRGRMRLFCDRQPSSAPPGR